MTLSFINFQLKFLFLLKRKHDLKKTDLKTTKFHFVKLWQLKISVKQTEPYYRVGSITVYIFKNVKNKSHLNKCINFQDSSDDPLLIATQNSRNSLTWGILFSQLLTLSAGKKLPRMGEWIHTAYFPGGQWWCIYTLFSTTSILIDFCWNLQPTSLKHSILPFLNYLLTFTKMTPWLDWNTEL